MSMCDCIASTGDQPVLGQIRSGPPVDEKTAMFSGGIVFDRPTRDPALRKAALDLLLALAEHGRVYSSTGNKLQAAMDALREELAK